MQRYPTDLTDTEWTLLAPLIPAAKPGGRPRTTDMREVVHAIFGGVSNVDMDGNNTLQIKAIRVVISTFETLPYIPSHQRYGRAYREWPPSLYVALPWSPPHAASPRTPAHAGANAPSAR